MSSLVQMNAKRAIPCLVAIMESQDDCYEARMSSRSDVNDPSVPRALRKVLKIEPSRHMRYTLIMTLKTMGVWKE